MAVPPFNEGQPRDFPCPDCGDQLRIQWTGTATQDAADALWYFHGSRQQLNNGRRGWRVSKTRIYCQRGCYDVEERSPWKALETIGLNTDCCEGCGHYNPTDHDRCSYCGGPVGPPPPFDPADFLTDGPQSVSP